MKLITNVIVAVARKSARTGGRRQMLRTPVRMSSAIDVDARGGCGGSRLSMRPTRSADDDERRRVDGDRERRGQPRDQRAAERGTRDLGDGVERLALAVRVEQAFPADEVGDVDVVGELEQHARDAGDRGDGEQQRQRQHPGPCGERNRRERAGADQVGADQHRPAAVPVDPAAAGERDQHAGQRRRGGEQAQVERARADDEDRRHRQRGARDARADRGDALRAPQQQEIAVPPQAAARPPRARATGGTSVDNAHVFGRQPVLELRDQLVVRD